ncbi:hypothetical protein P43SY_000189 [Pythium insidiosum]|uniref:Protein kinase domain-containing protein n=1 Tax=Pythium insidiosum TaxID=114742 RepID=A0AAD5QC85_PYTIN|nr:hypothetical protein P43SY_000189 [Pythium insidiosum]
MTAGIGTSFWIAPEVLLGRDYDERADIFSFGVVLSELDTEDYPYWNDRSEAAAASAADADENMNAQQLCGNEGENQSAEPVHARPARVPRGGPAQQQQQILKMVASGEMRPRFSDSCPPSVLSLASLCLDADPSNRPTAAMIVYELQRMQQQQ